MNNVKVKVGQVWKENQTGNDYVIDINPEGWISGQGKTFGFGGYSEFAILQEFTFQPQNDLEWLAVNVDKWRCDSLKFISRDDGCACFYVDDCNLQFLRKYNFYTRDQWQNMRYELGLDDKKHIQSPLNIKIVINDDLESLKPSIKYVTASGAELERLDNGEFIVVKGRISRGDVIIQKETEMSKEKMIDLSSTRVGDDYNGQNGAVYSIVITGNNDWVVKDVNTGSHYVLLIDGTFDGYRNHKLVSKHDPRHWLKDLPDADLFSCNIDTIKMCEDNGWLYTMNEGMTWHQINVIKMPTLTGEEWKLSKISIVELKEWQRNNNAT